MRRLVNKARHKLYDYWTRMMESTRLKMPLGAQYISKIISWGHKDNWRRNRRERKK